jgi:predicted HAD superfamily Cof-like phosphohydrolase
MCAREKHLPIPLRRQNGNVRLVSGARYFAGSPASTPRHLGPIEHGPHTEPNRLRSACRLRSHHQGETFVIDNKEGASIAVRVSGELGMEALLGDVAAFHRACDVPILAKPAFPDLARQKLRDDLLREEFNEFIDALDTYDIVKVADALADIIYIAAGTALEFGIPLDRVWAEVQRSNMAKVDPVSGKVTKREDGKVLKPEGWTPPDIAGAMGL